jgi:hypothetical protein
MAKKIKQFRLFENKNSKDFYNKLNSIVKILNKWENLKVTGPGHLSFYPNSINLILDEKSKTRRSSSSDETVASLATATITQTLEYATELTAGVSEYKGTISDPDNPSFNNTERNLKFYTEVDDSDYRNYVPWLSLDLVVPIYYYSGEYYIIGAFNYVGSSTEKSLSWNNDEDRSMAVFR